MARHAAKVPPPSEQDSLTRLLEGERRIEALRQTTEAEARRIVDGARAGADRRAATLDEEIARERDALDARIGATLRTELARQAEAAARDEARFDTAPDALVHALARRVAARMIGTPVDRAPEGGAGGPSA